MPGSYQRALRAGTASTEWQELFADAGSDILFQVNADGRIVWISPNAGALLGVDQAAFLNADMTTFMHPDDAVTVRAARERTLGGEAVDFDILRIRTVTGDYRSMSSRARPLRDPAGKVIGALISWQDITERMATDRAFATLLEGNRIMLRAHDEHELLHLMCDLVATIPGYAFAWYGVPVDDAAKSVAVVAQGGEDHGYVQSIRTSWGDGPLGQGPTGTGLRTGETQVRDDLEHDAGFAPWREQALLLGLKCSITLPVQVHGRIHGALMVYSTERNAFDDRAQQLLESLAGDLGTAIERFRTMAELQHEVDFDSLTGLAKKRLSLIRIQDILDTRRIQDWALFCVGVDGMTAINQAYTYSAGDQVLREVAERIVRVVGAHDRVGRIAGDEFVVLLRDVITSADAAEWAERILRAVRGPIHIGDNRVDISVCVGIAMRTDEDAEELLRDATAAMRHATKQGNDSWAFLDENVAASSRHILNVQHRLADALQAGAVAPWYMGLHDLRTGDLVGYESLARWRNEDGTVATPDAFLRIAERSMLVVDLDRTMLRLSLAKLAELDSNLHVAVNLSAATLRVVDLDEMVRAELRASGVDPHRLHLEVTETELFDANETTVQHMRSLAQLGVSWWVDDFGTGYSSISHLRDMPVAGVKLDRSFTSALESGDPHAASLTQGLAGLANGLGLDTVAEGVETEAQARLLAAQGWRLAQGWLYSRPCPLG